MKNSLCAMAVVLFAVTLLPACAGNQEGTAAGNGTPIKIGWLGPLTGTGAPYGTVELNGAKMAVEKINSAGGINGQPIQLIVEDGRCDGPTAATAAHKLIEVDGVKYILGGHCSTESLSIIPITEAKKVFLLAGTTSTNAFKGAGKYAFRTFPSAKVVYSKLAEFAVKKGTRTIVTLAEQKDYSQSVIESFTSTFKTLGGKVTTMETFAPGTSDFKTQLLKISQGSPDAIMISVQGPETSAEIIRQMNELGLTTQIYGDSLVVSKATYEKSQGLLPSTAVGGVPHIDPDASPERKGFFSSYKKRFGEPGVALFAASEGHDDVLILSELIKACGEDTDCARKEILHRTFEGISGPFRFGEDGDTTTPYIGLARIENGIEVYEDES